MKICTQRSLFLSTVMGGVVAYVYFAVHPFNEISSKGCNFTVRDLPPGQKISIQTCVDSMESPAGGPKSECPLANWSIPSEDSSAGLSATKVAIQISVRQLIDAIYKGSYQEVSFKIELSTQAESLLKSVLMDMSNAGKVNNQSALNNPAELVAMGITEEYWNHPDPVSISSVDLIDSANAIVRLNQVSDVSGKRTTSMRMHLSPTGWKIVIADEQVSDLLAHFGFL